MKPMKLKPKRLLLHVCCACCATEVYERLKNDYDVTLFWYNPNIGPFEEYKNRLSSFIKLCDDLKCDYLICHSEAKPKNLTVRSFANAQDDTSIMKYYQIDNKKWHSYIKGLENDPEGGKRCTKCFEFRLGETARYARKNNFDLFATTLTISPHKNADLINKIGNDIAAKNNIDFLESNFKKQDGFKKSIELSHKHDLYRQHYCGCQYSLKN